MIGRRRFTRRRLKRWLDGKLSLGALLRLKRSDPYDLALEAHRRIEAEDFDAARRLFELVGQLWPERDASVRLGLGVCAQRLGDFGEAERSYDHVLSSEPANVYALANRAEVRLLTARRDAARDDLATAFAAMAREKVPGALRSRVEKLDAIARSADQPTGPHDAASRPS